MREHLEDVIRKDVVLIQNQASFSGIIQTAKAAFAWL
jgi:hypothetical protein